MSGLTIKMQIQIEHFKRMFPDLITDWHGWSYSVNRNKEGIIIEKANLKDAPAYYFVYRSETDWELRCGKAKYWKGVASY